MKKIMIFCGCLAAALAVDFLREGLFSGVYAQLQKNTTVITGETPASVVKSGYPAPDPASKLKSPYPVSEKPDPAPGPYPSGVARPMENKASEVR
jgi:hypothetical protein